MSKICKDICSDELDGVDDFDEFDRSDRQLLINIFDILTVQGLLHEEENHRLKLELSETIVKGDCRKSVRQQKSMTERGDLEYAESRNI